MPTIKLQSSDEITFETDVEVAKCSGTIKTMLEDCGIQDDNTTVPLSNVNSFILAKVLHWATYHKDDPKVHGNDDDDKRERCTDDIPAWDAEFFKVDQGTLYEIILAANYLDMKGLLDLACKTVANMIKGKSPDEIRRTFNIRNDFIMEEEPQQHPYYARSDSSD